MRDSVRNVTRDPPTPPPFAPRARSAAVLLRGESISLARRAAATAKKRREEARAELERRGVREGVETALSTIVGASASTRANVSQNKAKRTKRVKWTGKEVQALKEGVAKYGEGRWAVILREYASEFNPVRISVDLKDKWRNLFKAQKLQVLEGFGGDVGGKVEERVEEGVRVEGGGVEVEGEVHQGGVHVEQGQVRVEGREVEVGAHGGKAGSALQAQLQSQMRRQQQEFGHAEGGGGLQAQLGEQQREFEQRGRAQLQSAVGGEQHAELQRFEHAAEAHGQVTNQAQEGVYALDKSHVEHEARIHGEGGHAQQVAHAQQMLNDAQIESHMQREQAAGEAHVEHARQVASSEQVSHQQGDASHTADVTEHAQAPDAQYAEHFRSALQAASRHQLEDQQIGGQQFHQQHVENASINPNSHGVLEGQQLAEQQLEQQQAAQQQLLSMQQGHQPSNQQLLDQQQLTHHGLQQHSLEQNHVEHSQSEHQHLAQQQGIEQQQLEQHQLHHEQQPDQQQFEQQPGQQQFQQQTEEQYQQQPEQQQFEQQTEQQQFQQQDMSHQQLQQASLQHHSLGEHGEGQEQVGKQEMQQAHVQPQQMEHHTLEQQPAVDGSHAGQVFEQHRVHSHHLEHESIGQQHTQALEGTHVGHGQVTQEPYHDGQGAQQFGEQRVSYEGLSQHQLAKQLAQEEIGHQQVQQQQFEHNGEEQVDAEQTNAQSHVIHGDSSSAAPDAADSMQMHGEQQLHHQQSFGGENQGGAELQLESRQQFEHNQHIDGQPNEQEHITHMAEEGQYGGHAQNENQAPAGQQFCSEVQPEEVHHGDGLVHTRVEEQLSAQQDSEQQNAALDPATSQVHATLEGNVPYGKSAHLDANQDMREVNQTGGEHIEISQHGADQAPHVTQGMGVGVESGANLVQEGHHEGGEHIPAPQGVLEDQDASGSVFGHAQAESGGHGAVQPHDSHTETDKVADYGGQYASTEAEVLQEASVNDSALPAESFAQLKAGSELVQTSTHEGKIAAALSEAAHIDVGDAHTQNDEKRPEKPDFTGEGGDAIGDGQGLSGSGSHGGSERLQESNPSEVTERQTSVNKDSSIGRNQNFEGAQTERVEGTVGACTDADGQSQGNVLSTSDEYDVSRDRTVTANPTVASEDTAGAHAPASFVPSDPNLLGCVIATGSQEEVRSENQDSFPNTGAIVQKLDAPQDEHEKDPSALVESTEHASAVGTNSSEIQASELKSTQTALGDIAGQSKDGQVNSNDIRVFSRLEGQDGGGDVAQAQAVASTIIAGDDRKESNAPTVDQVESTEHGNNDQTAAPSGNGFVEGEGKISDSAVVSQTAGNEVGEKLFDGERASCTLDNDDGEENMVANEGSQLGTEEGSSSVVKEQVTGSLGLKRSRSDGAVGEEYSRKRQATENKVGSALESEGNILETNEDALDINSLRSTEG